MMNFQWFAALVLIAMSVLALMYHNRLADATCPNNKDGNCMNDFDTFQFVTFIVGIIIGSVYLFYDLIEGGGFTLSGSAGGLRAGIMAQS
jgi:hypothetical protein